MTTPDGLGPTTSEARLVEQLQAALGARLQTVYRFGAQHSPDEDDGLGGQRLLVLVDAIDLRLLSQLAPCASQAHRLGLGLRVETVSSVKNAAGTFPVFTIEVRDTRVLLFGDDVLTDLAVPQDELRANIEQTLRRLYSELTHGYLRAADEQRVRARLTRVGRRTVYLMELLLQSKGVVPPAGRTPSRKTILGAATSLLDTEQLSVLERLWMVVAGDDRPSGESLYQLYADTMRLVAVLIDHADV